MNDQFALPSGRWNIGVLRASCSKFARLFLKKQPGKKNST